VVVLEGATDSTKVLEEVYVEHLLAAPSLWEGQVVVVVLWTTSSGRTAHTERIRELLIEARGAELVFLASYSSRS
jgi:hypothetical protein